eukprot:Sdes_comp10196_c0_seq1m1810
MNDMVLFSPTTAPEQHPPTSLSSTACPIQSTNAALPSQPEDMLEANNVGAPSAGADSEKNATSSRVKKPLKNFNGFKLSQVSLCDLLKANLLKPDEKITYKGAVAKISKDGLIEDEDHHIFSTPSGWAKYVLNGGSFGHLQVSGWDKVKRKKDGLPLGEIRSQFVDAVLSGQLIFNASPHKRISVEQKPASIKTPKKKTISSSNHNRQSSHEKEKKFASATEIIPIEIPQKTADFQVWHGTPILFTHPTFVPSLVCFYCGSCGQDSDCQFLQCPVCFETYHIYCIETISLEEVKTKPIWRCFNCLVCESCLKSEPEATLLVCDCCQKGFHLQCLDPPLLSIPDDAFFCAFCQKNDSSHPPLFPPALSPSNCILDPPNLTQEGDNRACLFCSKIGEEAPFGCGRLVPLLFNDWAHVKCILWSSEVVESQIGALSNVQQAINRSRSILCAHCATSGASIGCHAPRCKKSFHYACLQPAGSLMYPD